MQMMDILKEIAVYMFYLYIMFLISYGSRDQNSYGVLQSVTNTFGGAQYHGIRSLDNVSKLFQLSVFIFKCQFHSHLGLMP